MNRKLRLYLDTSVWSFPFHSDSPMEQGATQRLFDEIRADRFEVFSSGIAYNELKAAPEPRRSRLLELFDEINPTMIHVDDEIVELALHYIQGDMLSTKHRNDAMHIAVAVASNCDVLLSWNYRHIVRVKTRRIVNSTSRLLGYKEIEICAPPEVLGDDMGT